MVQKALWAPRQEQLATERDKVGSNWESIQLEGVKAMKKILLLLAIVGLVAGTAAFLKTRGSTH